MTAKPIIDAGPALAFFAIDQQDIVLKVLGKLSAPAAVEEEVMRKARQMEELRRSAAVWKKIKSGWIEILSDNSTNTLLVQAVERITDQRFAARATNSKDLGEVMVVAHAMIAARAGKDVSVVIDDADGIDMAIRWQSYFVRGRKLGHPFGAIDIIQSVDILREAVRLGLIADRGAMESLYSRLRQVNNSLLPIERTDLLAPRNWKR